MDEKEQMLAGFGITFCIIVMIVGIFYLSAPFTIIGMLFFFAFVGQIKEDRKKDE